jgi:hypothetical protein
MTNPLSTMPDRPAICGSYQSAHRVYCALLPDHDGPHGWDYTLGTTATLKRSEAVELGLAFDEDAHGA